MTIVGVIYVSLSALKAAKIVVATISSEYLIILVSQFIQGPRPYWLTTKIASPICCVSFVHPSRELFFIIFVPLFSISIFKIVSLNKQTTKGSIISMVVISVFSLLYSFYIYTLGEIFLLDIAFTWLTTLSFYFIFIQFRGQLTTFILNSTFDSYKSKKYIWYWFVASFLLAYTSFLVL